VGCNSANILNVDNIFGMVKGGISGPPEPGRPSYCLLELLWLEPWLSLLAPECGGGDLFLPSENKSLFLRRLVGFLLFLVELEENPRMNPSAYRGMMPP
jgi:hypothetical protein